MFSKIEEWKASGSTQKQFCQENKIPLSSFFYWHKKYRNQESGSTAFIPITLHAGKNEAKNIEIIYPNGVRIQLPSNIRPSALGEFIRMF
jgi:hypothetical protein